MTSLMKVTDSIPQSASYTPFSTPIPAIFYFALLILRPEKTEK